MSSEQAKLLNAQTEKLRNSNGTGFDAN